MSIVGRLQDLSLADIIQAIAGGQKTGVLYVNTDQGKSSIVFKNGFVVSASKPDLTLRLGQLLRKQDGISEPELEMCLREQQLSGRPLGEILLERSLVTREQLQAMMKLQVMETVIEIVNLEEGSFSFHSEPQLPSDLISYDAQHLLLDVAFLKDSMVNREPTKQQDGFWAEKLIAEFEDAQVALGGRTELPAPVRAVGLLRELSEELARPSESTEVSLLLLRLAAEYFDRCLFFVVKGDSLVVCGGFGFPMTQDSQREPNSEPIYVPLQATSVFQIAYDNRKTYRGELLEGSWGKELIRGLSGHLPSEVIVVPIACQDSVIALLYGDNGEGQANLPPMDLLEVLLLQAGMALENKRLRDKLLRLTAAVSVQGS